MRRAIRYVAARSRTLIKRIAGRSLKISYLTLYTHRPQEYERLYAFMSELGKPEEVLDGTKFTLKVPLRTGAGPLKRVRIRRPDPYRAHVGAADFDVGDYTDFRDAEMEQNQGDIRLIQREGYEIMEFHHPDFDIFAYVPSISSRLY